MAVRFAAALAFVGVLCVAGRTAAADSAAVLEVYVADRPADAASILAPVVAELATRGYLTDAGELGAQLGAVHSRSAPVMTDSDFATASLVVDAGYSAFQQLDMAGAVTKLAPALEQLLAQPATIAANPTRRDVVYKAMVGLMLAHKRLKRLPEGRLVAAELARSFADRHFNRAQFGPEGHELHRKAVEELEALGRGGLTVELDDQAVDVYLNERKVGVGSFTSDALLPGTYRVYLQKGAQSGRLRTIDVVPAKTARVTVQWAVDAAIRTEAGFVGLVFASEAERVALQNSAAVELARSLGARGVVLLGVRNVGARRAVIGSAVSVDTAKPDRAAWLRLEPTVGEQEFRSLAGYLAGGPLASGLVAGEGNAVAVNRGAPPDANPPRPFRIWKWVVPIAGVAAMSYGGYMISIHGDRYVLNGSPVRWQRNTIALGGAAVAGGAAAVALGVYFWVRDERDQQAAPRVLTSVSPLPDGRGAVLLVTGSF